MHAAVLGPTNAAVHDRGVLRRWRDAHRAHAAPRLPPRGTTAGAMAAQLLTDSNVEIACQRSAIRGMDTAADSHYRRGAPRSARSRRRRRASPKATATPGIANGRRPPTDCMPRPRDAPRAVRGSARYLYQRASTYYRTSYPLLFGRPIDPRVKSGYAREAEAFARAAALFDPPTTPG